MKGRTLVAVLLSVLLPLPLVWLLSTALFHGYGSFLPRSRSMDVVPMLTLEESRHVLTYEHECRTDADCDPRLRCVFNMLLQHSTCVDSSCLTDQQCPTGFTCQTRKANNGKDLINFCSLVGVRKEGEVCTMHPREREGGCERGLLCHFRCGRPCQVDNPASCPQGYFCEDEPLVGPACQPTCEGRTCPEGQRCISVSGRVSICATVHGQDCQRHPCEQGQVCSVAAYPKPADEVWMSCVRSCGIEDDEQPCPHGTICEAYRCHKTCTAEDPMVCGPGFTCKRRPEEPWLCAPDVRANGVDGAD